MAASWLFKSFACLYLIKNCELQFASNVSGTSNTLVRTVYGILRGTTDFTNRPAINKYYGIPFAKAPTGPLRFKQPEPPRPWSGVRDATRFGARCLQGTSNFRSQLMSEDCLFLNVYTPLAREGRPFPVMVWIHGGGYIFGSGENFDGTVLAGKGVVVVTINYRLDIFGFMSTEDGVIPGNFGMLDQILALKWVQQNIANFGGDPNRVTVFGESAGSGSVSLLILSPLARGLFQRAIMESGTSLSPWAVFHPATRMSPRSFAKLVGVSSGCPQNSSVQFLQCMQSKPARTLLLNRYNSGTTFNSRKLMVPQVDNAFGFLPDIPIRLLNEGRYNHVDTIRGYNTHERGAVISNPERGVTRRLFRTWINRTFAPYSVPDEDRFLNYIEDYYLGYITDPILMLQRLSAFRTDFAFVGPTINEIRLAASTSPEKKHYLYEFNYRPSYSSMPQWVTAVHGDEINFVFGSVRTKNDRLVSEQMMTMWTNFAKTGNPTNTLPYGAVQWQPFTPVNQRLLKINTVSFSLTFRNPQIADLYSEILQKLLTPRESSAYRRTYY